MKKRTIGTLLNGALKATGNARTGQYKEGGKEESNRLRRETSICN
jgi:hypothetical protein